MVDADEIARRNTAQLMEEQNISQAELVRRVLAKGHTFDTATLNRVLHGHQPARGHLEKLAAGLETTMSRLLDEGNGEDTDPVPSADPSEASVEE